MNIRERASNVLGDFTDYLSFRGVVEGPGEANRVHGFVYKYVPGVCLLAASDSSRSMNSCVPGVRQCGLAGLGRAGMGWATEALRPLPFLAQR